MKTAVLLICFFLYGQSLSAQNELSELFADSSVHQEHLPVLATFKSPGLINAQTNETIHQHELLFKIDHRFGDLAGANGGMKHFFGFDNATDILIGFDYGITDRINIGAGRAKGAANGTTTNQQQLWYVRFKYRLLRQTTDDHVPLSVSLSGDVIFSSMKRLAIATSDADFQGLGDRMSFTGHLILARKFSDHFSLEILPTYIRRNYVSFMEMNNLFAVGIGARWKMTPHMAIVADYFLPLRSKKSTDYFKTEDNFSFYHPLGVGLEIETGGHVFCITVTNAAALLENQFIPSTNTSWTKGQFRWGFNLNRTFTLFRKRPVTHPPSGAAEATPR